MKLQYFGTGAGAGIPEPFCSCTVCQDARKQLYSRSRSLAVINDELCIDYPGDARSSFLSWRFDARKLRYLLITHSHYDHFQPLELMTRPAGRAHPLELYISRGSGEYAYMIAERMRKERKSASLRPLLIPTFHFVEPFRPEHFGSYIIIPLPANHDRKLDCMNYIIGEGETWLLWLHDTGPLLNETKSYLSSWNIPFAFASMDCSKSDHDDDQKTHLNLSEAYQIKEFLFNKGLLSDHASICLSHISHNTDLTKHELETKAEALGLQVAQDGMCLIV